MDWWYREVRHGRIIDETLPLWIGGVGLLQWVFWDIHIIGEDVWLHCFKVWILFVGVSS